MDEVSADLLHALSDPALLDVENTDILELDPTVPPKRSAGHDSGEDSAVRQDDSFAGDVMVCRM